MSKKYQVVHSSTGGWDVKTTGGKMKVEHFPTKGKAVGKARELAKNSSTGVIILNKDGKISEVNLYSHKRAGRVIRSSPEVSKSRLKRSDVRKSVAKAVVKRSPSMAKKSRLKKYTSRKAVAKAKR